MGDTTFLIRYFFRAKEMKSQNGLNWKGEINYRFNTNWCCENHFMIPYILKLISSAYNHLKTVSDETMSDTSESGYGNSRKNVYIDKCLRPEWIFVGSEVHFGGVGRTLCKLDKTCTSDPFQSLKLISRFTYRMYSSL